TPVARSASAGRSGAPAPTTSVRSLPPATAPTSSRSTARPPSSCPWRTHDRSSRDHPVTPALIAVAVVAFLVLVALVRTVRIVPQATAGIIERLGRYPRTCTPGLTVLVPFVDRMRPLIDLREQVVSFPPQPVITEDNLVVGIDTVIYFQVTDPRSATYEVANFIQAIEQLTVTTLRNVIGGLDLEATLTSRDQINGQLRGVLDEATGKWGIRV